MLLKGAQIAVEALEAENGLKFKYGSVCKTIYRASGSSVDSMYALGVKYPYTVELRDEGQKGFLLPPSQIIESGKEVTKAMFALYKFIAEQENLK